MHAHHVPESRLADVLLGELFPLQEIDDTFVDLVLDDLELGDPGESQDYAFYEIVRDALATAEFVRVRDTRYDHVVTVEFPKLSAPYEKIELEAAAPVDVADEEMQLDLEDLEIEHEFFAQGDAPGDARFMAYANARPFPLYSAPFERVELGEIPSAIEPEETEMIAPARTGSLRVFALAAVLTIAIAAAVGLALLVIRSATV